MSIEAIYNIYRQYPTVQTDTRKLKKGDLFFALKGDNFNGNAYAKQAIEKGAAYAIIDEEQYEVPGKTILVENVLDTLQHLARHHRLQFNIPVLAITGSNGKTTTKELVHAVLSTSFKTYTTEGNLNNHIGVPLTLLKIREDAEMAVIEMGANHLCEIASYCEYAKPTHGLITNCGKAHLEGFGGLQGVKQGKGELFDYLRNHNGAAFIMKDYDYLQDMSKGISSIITYGSKDTDIEGRVAGSEPFLTVAISNKPYISPVQTQLVGEYNFPNVLAAVAVGGYFKVPDSKIKAAIESYTPSNSRSQLIQKGSNTIILDAYNANPSSMKAAIENFAKIKSDKKILILGSMAELGEEGLSEHKTIVELICNHKWDEVVLVGGDFLKIEHSFITFNNAAEAKVWLQQQQYENTHLLIKGSRSMKMELVLED